ncbi:MAG: hypothetical protein ACK5DD_12730 [Cyclobacteriaceae bacterium]
MKPFWIVGMICSVTALAQETDDMYFRGKDREVVTAVRNEQWNKQRNAAREASEVKTTINPSDSYSGRNVNPEYNSQVKVDPAAAEQAAYFVPDYSPTGINQNLVAANPSFNNFNNAMFMPSMAFNSGFGNPWGGWGWNDPFMMNGWNSGWGMGFNNCFSCMGGWGSPWGFNNGWTMSLGFGWGMNSWNNPWGWNSWGNPWNSGWGWNRPIVVVNNNIDANNPIVYGKRQNRSSVTNQVYDNSRSQQVTYTRGGRETSGGRTRADNSQYYDRSWRSNNSNPNTNTNRSYWGNSSGSSSRGYWSNSSGRGSYDGGSNSRSYDGGSNSRSYNYDGGGSRSSGYSGGYSGSGGSSSGSSGGRRGRN